MLADEALLVIERLNAATVTSSNLLQTAVHSILSKKAGANFKKRIEDLSVTVGPRGALGKPLVSDEEADEED